MKQQQEFTTLYFNHGASVMWAEGTYVRFGEIECEHGQRPGHYYVRNEHGDLETIHFGMLQLSRRA